MTLRVGRYETLRPLASGGMATVYLGRALGAGGFERLVAIKVMHAHIAEDPEFVAMFLDEARLAARVRHPNVVATIDVQQADASDPAAPVGATPRPLILVMEYIEGPSLQVILRELRKEKGAIPLGIAIRIFLDILSGLHAAHELTGPDGASLNLIHRDVSPQNLLVGTDGISRITDFGVARAESRLSSTRGGQLKGKIAYMSPEQIRTDATDRRCDVYAAGAVLWETLVGQRLFKADNDGAMVAKILAGTKQSPRDLNFGIPAELDEVCMRALRVDPDERYGTASDFAEALEEAAAAARIPIASTRAVSAFIKDLALPEAISSPPASSTRGASGSGSSGSRRAGPEATPPPSFARSRLVDEPSAPSASSVGVAGVSGSTQAGAVMSFAPPRRPRRGLYLAAVVLMLGAGGALFFAGRMTTERAAGSALEGAPSPVEPKPVSAAPTAVATATATAEPPPAETASASASARIATSPPPPVAQPSVPRAPQAQPRPKPTGAAKPPASPTSFRPSDL